jgi:RNA polymerase sigma-70 factor (ECF subfamily)
VSLADKKQRAEGASRPGPPSGKHAPGEDSPFNREDFRQIDPLEASVTPEDQETREPPHGPESAKSLRKKELLVCFRLIAEGRLSALSDLYDVLGRGLFGYIRTILGAVEDSEDVLQEVFARLAQHRRKLVRVENPTAYVFAIARNESFKLLKARSRARPTEPDEAIFEWAAPALGGTPLLSAAEAQAAMRTLPPLQREVVVLKIYEGFTFAEIGRLTGVSPNTAASRYRYALAKLAEKLKRYRGSEM